MAGNKKPNKKQTGKKKTGNQQGLTPYQGHRRVYGYFQCPECQRRWTSGNSWANMGQECQTCLINVYPYRQEQLKKWEDEEGDEGEEQYRSMKPHPMHLCEMCKKLRSPCWERDRR